MRYLRMSKSEFKTSFPQLNASPKTKRLTIYQQALSRRGIAAKDRLAIIKAFATHARRVSDQYQNTRRKLNVKPWQSLLAEGWKAAPIRESLAPCSRESIIVGGNS